MHGRADVFSLIIDDFYLTLIRLFEQFHCASAHAKRIGVARFMNVHGNTFLAVEPGNIFLFPEGGGNVGEIVYFYQRSAGSHQYCGIGYFRDVFISGGDIHAVFPVAAVEKAGGQRYIAVLYNREDVVEREGASLKPGAVDIYMDFPLKAAYNVNLGDAIDSLEPGF